MKQYVCRSCGKKVREPARFVPPMHCGVPMREVGAYGRSISFPTVFPREKKVGKKRRAAKAGARKARKPARKAARKARSRR